MVERYLIPMDAKQTPHRADKTGDWVRFTDHEATIATLRAELEEARRRVASLETSIEKTAELEREGYKALHYSEELQRAEAAEMKLIAAEASLAEVRKALEVMIDHYAARTTSGVIVAADEQYPQIAQAMAALARLDTPEKK